MTGAKTLIVVSGYPAADTQGGGKILHDLISDLGLEPTICLSDAFVDSVPKDMARRQVYVISSKPFALHSVRHLLSDAANAAGLLRRRPRGAPVLFIPWGGAGGSRLALIAIVLRLLGHRLITYEMDEWRAAAARRGRLAREGEARLHGPILRLSSHIFAISDAMRDRLEMRSGRPVSVLASSATMLAARYETLGGECSTKKVVLFLGAVYDAQVDAVSNVMKAVEITQGSDPEWLLVIHSGQPETEIRQMGLTSKSVLVRPFARGGELAEAISSADVLLLPYSFRPEMREIVSTSYPTKAADYLASGVPVLVHAPNYSTIAQAAAKEGWAAVVAEADPNSILRALQSLLDPAVAGSLLVRASAIAAQRHSIERNRADFVDAVWA